MNNVVSTVKNRSGQLISKGVHQVREHRSFLISCIPFAVAVLTQMLILFSGSRKGLHDLPYMGMTVVIIMDAFAVLLRLATKRRFNPLIAYIPQTLLCFGICIQSAASAVGNYADSALEMQSNVNHMNIGLVFFFIFFFFFGIFAWIMEAFPIIKWFALGAMIVPPLLTVAVGTMQNDALTGVSNVQVYHLVLIVFVFLASSVFQQVSTPGKRAVYFIAYLAILSVLFYVMREFGTLLVLWVASIVAILTDIDFSRIGLFWSGGFGVIGKIISAIARFFRSLSDKLIVKINPKMSRSARRKIRRVIFWSVVALIILVVLINIIAKSAHLLSDIKGLYRRKIERRVYPWLNIGSNVDDHQEALSKCFVNAGWFGNDIIECVFPPHFHEDCSTAMLFQLFGWVGGVLFLGTYFVFLWTAHFECSCSSNKDFKGLGDLPFVGILPLPESVSRRINEAQFFRAHGKPVNTARYALTATILLSTQVMIPVASAIKLLPIIGICTPLISGGGMQYIVLFTLLGIIMSECYTSAMDTLPTLSEEEDPVSLGQRLKRIFLGKPAIITYLVILSIVLLFSFSLLVALNSFNNYVTEKCDIMNRIDYHYSATDTVAPAKEVEDIPLPDDPDIQNALIIGLDNAKGGKKAESGARSDSMILISLNRREKTIKVFSLQRDTYLSFADNRTEKLNAAYKFGGMQLLTDTIKKNYRIPIHTTARIDRSRFKKIINAMGGVDIKLSDIEADYLNKRPKDCGLKKEYERVSEGKNHLDGWQTLEYVRMRHANKADNDYNRAERQQKAIAAMIDRFKKLVGNIDIKGLEKAIDAIAEEVDTNISGEEVSELMPDAAISLLKIMGPDGMPKIERFHVPDRYYSDSYFEYGAWRLKPELRRTALFLRTQIYGKDSLKGLKIR